jgi:hypothetical protein
MADFNLNPFNPLDSSAEAQLAIPGLPGVFDIQLNRNGIGITNLTAPLQNQNFNINKFVGNLHKHRETARADKFDVRFSVPSGLRSSGTIDPGVSMQDLSLQCEVSELPGRDINMIEYRKYSFIERIPHHNQYGQASFTVVVTGDMWEKRFFDAWMDYMVPAQTGLVNYAETSDGQRNWEADITCFQYDNEGNPAYAVKLIDACPISCAPLSQSWDNDSIHRLQLGFQFRKWISDTTVTNSATQFGQPFQLPFPSGVLSTAGITTAVQTDLRTAGAAVSQQVNKLIQSI